MQHDSAKGHLCSMKLVRNIAHAALIHAHNHDLPAYVLSALIGLSEVSPTCFRAGTGCISRAAGLPARRRGGHRTGAGLKALDVALLALLPSMRALSES